MPILRHYEVTINDGKIIVLLTEHDAAKLGAIPVDDLDTKMRQPDNKLRAPVNKGR